MPSFSKVSTSLVLIVSILVIVSPHAHAQYPTKPPVEHWGPSSGWHRLKDIGPGHDAVVTLGDGTLRGGWIAGVDDSHLSLQSAGKTLQLAPADIASVRVKRSDRTLVYSVLGYIVTGTACTIIAYNDEKKHDHKDENNRDFKDLSIIFGVTGIPGGLIGAAIGHQRGGDVEIVP